MTGAQHQPNAAQPVPVIAIDGPTASGKGTVASLVAKRLGFHYLDSGAIYRVLAYAAMQQWPNMANWQQAANGLTLNETTLKHIETLAWQLPVEFKDERIWLNQPMQPIHAVDVSEAIRTEAVGHVASALAALPGVRNALLARQQAFRQAPGLVADGRDMGTVVFPDAALKVFLTASPEVRAQRRVAQLNAKATPGQAMADYPTIYAELLKRDARDTNRPVAPLKPSADAHILDTSEMGVEAAVLKVMYGYLKSKQN